MGTIIKRINNHIKTELKNIKTVGTPFTSIYLGSLEINQLKAQAAEHCSLDFLSQPESIGDLENIDERLIIYEVCIESHLRVV